jgi:PKD repeat protein
VNVDPNDTVICEGNSITLDAGEHPLNPFYVWDNGSLEKTRTVSDAGMYTVKVQNNIGCFDIDTINVAVHPEPLINSIAIIDNGDGSFTFNAIGAQNIFNYTWNFDDGSSNVSGSGLPGQVIHTFVCGDYNVTLTLNNDCGTVVATRLISIDCLTGIDNISELQKEISIVNLMGQTVYKNDKVNAEQIEINTTGFASGLYNVMINTEKGMITKKLEITK